MIEDVARRCAAVRTLSTARAITRHYDDAVRSVGITAQQFTLLVAIGRARPTSISEIGDALSMDRSSVTRNLRLLEEAGLVTRSSEGEKRRRAVKLTRKGQAKLREAYPLWEAAQARVEALFEGTGFEAAMSGLRTLRSLSSIESSADL